VSLNKKHRGKHTFFAAIIMAPFPSNKRGNDTYCVYKRLAVRIGGFYPFKKSAPTIGDQKDFSTRRLLLKIQIK
jgi:hypothetical protein